VGEAHHKSLKKLFQEAGIPTWLRNYVPLIYIDDRLAAVGGLWRCEWFASYPDLGIRWEGHPWEEILINAGR
jgi:tRNA(Ile)-lysidine synthase